MAENENEVAASEDARPERQLNIERIYLKDLSFENPNAPGIFREQQRPEIDLNLTSNVVAVDEERYEVVLSVTLTVRAQERTVYLVEVQQAGLFVLRGFNDQEKAHLLGSYCPHTLFPYAREAVSDIVTKGGFPPFLLSPVNFDAIYAKHLEEQKNRATPRRH